MIGKSRWPLYPLPLVIFSLTGIGFGVATSRAETMPEVVAEARITRCEYVSIIEGRAEGRKPNNWQAKAKEAALIQAKNISASHVVWNDMITLDYMGGVVIGKAYRCK